MASFMYEKIKAREQKMSNNNKLPESDDRIEVIINYKKTQVILKRGMMLGVEKYFHFGVGCGVLILYL